MVQAGFKYGLSDFKSDPTFFTLIAQTVHDIWGKRDGKEIANKHASFFWPFLEKANPFPTSKQQVETQGLSKRIYSRQRAFTERPSSANELNMDFIELHCTFRFCEGDILKFCPRFFKTNMPVSAQGYALLFKCTQVSIPAQQRVTEQTRIGLISDHHLERSAPCVSLTFPEAGWPPNSTPTWMLSESSFISVSEVPMKGTLLFHSPHSYPSPTSNSADLESQPRVVLIITWSWHQPLINCFQLTTSRVSQMPLPWICSIKKPWLKIVDVLYFACIITTWTVPMAFLIFCFSKPVTFLPTLNLVLFPKFLINP